MLYDIGRYVSIVTGEHSGKTGRITDCQDEKYTVRVYPEKLDVSLDESAIRYSDKHSVGGILNSIISLPEHLRPLVKDELKRLGII